MADTSTDQTTTDQSTPTDAGISPEEATRVIVAGATALQRNWLQAAVAVSQALTKGQAVTPGTFEDLRRTREQFEELDRAAGAVNRIAQAAEKAKQDGAAKS